MSTPETYEEHFQPGPVPDALAKLIEFDEDRGWFASGFEMDCSYFDKSLARTYSTDEKFLKGFKEFAMADGTGSVYALWSETGDWEKALVVAFGSEGGVQVVAGSFVDFLRILSFDTEPMIDWDRIFYYKSKDAEPCDGAGEYAEWLEETFHVKPVAGKEEVDGIIKNAQGAHKARFDKWMRKYYEG